MAMWNHAPLCAFELLHWLVETRAPKSTRGTRFSVPVSDRENDRLTASSEGAASGGRTETGARRRAARPETAGTGGAGRSRPEGAAGTSFALTQAAAGV